jgi:dTDP-glucose 4,6-dehydratase
VIITLNILVTGGAGFIGSNFLIYMINKYPNYSFVNLDALTYSGNLENLRSIESKTNYSFVKANLLDLEKLDSIFSNHNFDIVVNFAAESHVDRSITDPSIFLKTNILGTQNLLDLSLKYQVKLFHQVSTDEVYGDLPLDKLDLKFTESTPIHTSSPYSASKASADLLALAYHRTFDLPLTISRCSNNYGPFQFPEKLIPLMITRALNDEKLPVYGKGENVRDWIYVEEHCQAIDLIIHKPMLGHIFNIGGDQEKTNLEVVQAIIKSLDKDNDLIQYVQDRMGHDLRYAIDSSKMDHYYNWKPKIKFEEGLKRTIEWYLKNTSWWKNIISGEYKNYFSDHYSEVK